MIEWGNGKCHKVEEGQMLYSGGMANVTVNVLRTFFKHGYKVSLTK